MKNNDKELNDRAIYLAEKYKNIKKEKEEIKKNYEVEKKEKIDLSY